MSYSGLETLYACSAPELRTPTDVLVLFLHWKLTKEGFLCVGAGDDSSRSGSELLPSGWNSDPNLYQLNYKDGKGKVYLTKVIVAGESAIVNLLRKEDNKNSDVTLTVKDYISEDLSNYESVFTNKEELARKVENLAKEILQQKSGEGQRDDAEQSRPPQPRAPQSEQDPDPLRIGRPRIDTGPPGWEGVGPRIGGSDLDPLGRMGGGGMLMDPTGGGRPMMPRWDPVGPRNPYGMGGIGGDPYGGGIGGDPYGGGIGGMGPRGGGGIGGMGPRGGGRGGRRNFGDAMRPPGFDNDNMFM